MLQAILPKLLPVLLFNAACLYHQSDFPKPSINRYIHQEKKCSAVSTREVPLIRALSQSPALTDASTRRRKIDNTTVQLCLPGQGKSKKLSIIYLPRGDNTNTSGSNSPAGKPFKPNT